MDRKYIMEKWDYIRDCIENYPGASLPRDMFESILDEYQEKIDKLEAENNLLKQLVKDTVDGMDCLETCDSYGHDDLCPVANPEAAWRKLREENERFKRALEEIANPCNEADANSAWIVAKHALKGE